jgi:hypothetical protein
MRVFAVEGAPAAGESETSGFGVLADEIVADVVVVVWS